MPKPSLQAAVDAGARRLERVSGSARLDAELLLCHALGRDRAWLHAHGGTPVEDAAAARYEQLLSRRAAGEPVAYITGTREFWSLALKVTPAVLIPRPDTETLVLAALDLFPDSPPANAADLGTGCGAVALALAREWPACAIVATERSEAALEVASENAATHAIDNVEFRLASRRVAPLPHEAQRLPHEAQQPGHRGSGIAAHSAAPTAPLPHEAQQPGHRGSGIAAHSAAPTAPLPHEARRPGHRGSGIAAHSAAPTAPLPHEARRPGHRGSDAMRRDPGWCSPFGVETFELVVSNPPYVADGDPHLDAPGIVYEPREALAAGADGLDAIRAIVSCIPAHLAGGGWLLLEHGMDQADAVSALLDDAGFEAVRTWRDLGGRDRVTGGRHRGA